MERDEKKGRSASTNWRCEEDEKKDDRISERGMTVGLRPTDGSEISSQSAPTPSPRFPISPTSPSAPRDLTSAQNTKQHGAHGKAVDGKRSKGELYFRPRSTHRPGRHCAGQRGFRILAKSFPKHPRAAEGPSYINSICQIAHPSYQMASHGLLPLERHHGGSGGQQDGIHHS